jgi:hypothetical protein
MGEVAKPNFREQPHRVTEEASGELRRMADDLDRLPGNCSRYVR